VLRSPVFRRTVLEPKDIARHVVGLIGKAPRETTIPRSFRLFGIVQTLAPNLVARVVARRSDSAYRF
jgi:hypothetical protein